MILSQEIIKNAARESKRSVIFESYTPENKFRFDEKKEYDLFISHSFSDKDLIFGLKYLFEKSGYDVYIDWINDSQLDRSNVNDKTAQLVKRRIAASKGLAYISTSNSTTSKWCPWELGVADGMSGNVCILPVMDSKFVGQEYLGIYPYIEYDKTSGDHRDEFWVYDPKDRRKYIVLREWIKGKKPYIHN